jgi:hypothetical protein
MVIEYDPTLEEELVETRKLLDPSMETNEHVGVEVNV